MKRFRVFKNVQNGAEFFVCQSHTGHEEAYEDIKDLAAQLQRQAAERPSPYTGIAVEFKVDANITWPSGYLKPRRIAPLSFQEQDLLWELLRQA